jgi:murein L,D-transpeptidase YcbB/YkuD
VQLRLRRQVFYALALGLAAGAGFDPPDQRNPRLALVLNIPANRLDVYEDGQLTRSYRVSVGLPEYRTPAGSYFISRVVWNPWWVPPPGAKWARGQRKTPPGPGNPMGRVKLYFRELYYLHGTPNEAQLGEPASHGCVRLSNRDAIELARLVHRYASPDVTDAEINWLLRNTRHTRTIWLKRRVPLEVVYDVVEVRDGVLHIHPDVYRKSGKTVRERAIQALMREGYDISLLDMDRLRKVIQRGQRRGVAVPVEMLIPTAAGADMGR